jgi:hypothetical protein
MRNENAIAGIWPHRKHNEKKQTFCTKNRQSTFEKDGAAKIFVVSDV